MELMGQLFSWFWWFTDTFHFDPAGSSKTEVDQESVIQIKLRQHPYCRTSLLLLLWCGLEVFDRHRPGCDWDTVWWPWTGWLVMEGELGTGCASASAMDVLEWMDTTREYDPDTNNRQLAELVRMQWRGPGMQENTV
jgi:hypothetical protein